MVKTIKNLILYWRFRRAVKRCAEMNATRPTAAGQYIVANICGWPYIINRRSFRKLRAEGLFRAGLTWVGVYKKRVTPETLKRWIS